MAVYNSLQPLTQVADLPEFQQPTWFRKRDGSSTMFSDIFNVVVPAAATIGGMIIAGPAGGAVGGMLGQAAVAGVNRISSKNAKKQGAEDAQAQIDSDLAPNMAMAGLSSNIAGMFSIKPGTPAVGASTAQVTAPDADPSGLGQGVMDATGMSGFNQAKNTLVNQFNQPAAAATPWQVRMSPPSAEDMPGLIQQGVMGVSKKPRNPFRVNTSYQTFAGGGLPQRQTAGGQSTSIARPEKLPFLKPSMVVDPKIKEAVTGLGFNQKEKLALSTLQQIAGNPSISFDEPGKGFIKRQNGENREHFNPFTNTMSLTRGDMTRYLTELTHAKQLRDRGLFGMSKLEDMPYDIGSVFSSKINAAGYRDVNTTEYEAHQVIEPKLVDLYDYLTGDKERNERKLVKKLRSHGNIKTFADGGLTEEPGKKSTQVQAVNKGADFIKEWYLIRAMNGQAGLTPNDTDIATKTAYPSLVGKETFDRIRKPGSYGTVAGYYKGKEIRPGFFKGDTYIADIEKDPVALASISAHEANHQVQWESLGALSDRPHPAWVQTEKAIKQELKRSGKPFNEYYSEPREVHSRLMQIRQDAGFKPGQVVTPEMYWKYKYAPTQNVLQELPTMDLMQVLDAQGIINLLNKTVMNKSATNGFFRAADGGKAGTNYRRYLDTDKTEDLDLVDKKTGKKIGAMRYGERIYDQKATDTLEKAVRILNMEPSEEGFSWLGKFIVSETNTHKDFQQNFAGGGMPTTSLINPNLAPYLSNIGILPTGFGMGRPEAPKLGFFNRLFNRANRQAYRQISDLKANDLLWQYKVSQGIASVVPPLPGQMFADGGKPTPEQDVRKLQQFLAFNGYYSGSINGKLDKATQDAVYAYNKTIKNDELAQIPIGENENGKLNVLRLPINETGSTDLSSLGTFVINKSKKAVSPASGMPAPAAPSSPPPPPPPAEPATPPKKYNWLSAGNVADAGRALVGYTQASRDLPENPINPDYLKLVGDARQQQTEGLGVASRKLYSDQIDDSRTLGIEGVRRILGGGGSAGAAVAGLAGVNQATNDAALKLAAANEQANLVKQSRYTGLLGGLIDQQQQRYAQTFNAALLNRQAGMTLAQQGLQGIQDRADIWNLYDNPDSPVAKYEVLQQENLKESTKAAKNNYAYIGRLLTGQGK